LFSQDRKNRIEIEESVLAFSNIEKPQSCLDNSYFKVNIQNHAEQHQTWPEARTPAIWEQALLCQNAAGNPRPADGGGEMALFPGESPDQLVGNVRGDLDGKEEIPGVQQRGHR
jgi:hypothetical protein